MDLESEFDFYFKRINEARESFNLYKGILSNIKGNEKQVKHINSFLYEVLNSLKFSFVVQTSKLIDEREDKNIFKLLNVCKNYKNKFRKEIYNDYLNTETNEIEHIFIKKVDILDEINIFESELKKFTKQISNIKAHRDKIYAHNDKEYFYKRDLINEKYKVTYNDIDEILKLLFDKLNIISIDYNGRAYSAYPSSLDDYLYILKKLK